MSELIDLIATQREVNGELERLLKDAVEQVQENDARFADLKAYFPWAMGWHDLYRAIERLLEREAWIDKNMTYAEFMMSGRILPADQVDGGHTWERGQMGEHFSPTQWVDACIKWEKP